MTTALWLLAAVGCAVAAEGLIVRWHVVNQIVHAYADAPIDDRTGLLNQRALDDRITGELRRLQRMSGHRLWLSVWMLDATVADDFGRRAHAQLEFPDMGFRIDETTFVFARVLGTDEREPLFATHLLALVAEHDVRHGVVTAAGDVSRVEPRQLVETAVANARPGGSS